MLFYHALHSEKLLGNNQNALKECVKISNVQNTHLLRRVLPRLPSRLLNNFCIAFQLKYWSTNFVSSWNILSAYDWFRSLIFHTRMRGEIITFKQMQKRGCKPFAMLHYLFYCTILFSLFFIKCRKNTYRLV